MRAASPPGLTGHLPKTLAAYSGVLNLDSGPRRRGMVCPRGAAGIPLGG
jgi:hypothetical protein